MSRPHCASFTFIITIIYIEHLLLKALSNNQIGPRPDITP
jgi:hypothetical protein